MIALTLSQCWICAADFTYVKDNVDFVIRALPNRDPASYKVWTGANPSWQAICNDLPK
jgi:nucleoside-diphosphate-sugar epimerase